MNDLTLFVLDWEMPLIRWRCQWRSVILLIKESWLEAFPSSCCSSFISWRHNRQYRCPKVCSFKLPLLIVVLSVLTIAVVRLTNLLSKWSPIQTFSNSIFSVCNDLLILRRQKLCLEYFALHSFINIVVTFSGDLIVRVSVYYILNLPFKLSKVIINQFYLLSKSHYQVIL